MSLETPVQNITEHIEKNIAQHEKNLQQMIEKTNIQKPQVNLNNDAQQNLALKQKMLIKQQLANNNKNNNTNTNVNANANANSNVNANDANNSNVNAIGIAPDNFNVTANSKTNVTTSANAVNANVIANVNINAPQENFPQNNLPKPRLVQKNTQNIRKIPTSNTENIKKPTIIALPTNKRITTEININKSQIATNAYIIATNPNNNNPNPNQKSEISGSVDPLKTTEIKNRIAPIKGKSK